MPGKAVLSVLFAKTFIDNVGYSTKVLRNRRKVVIHQIISSFLSCVYRLDRITQQNRLIQTFLLYLVAQKNCEPFFEDSRLGKILSKIECTSTFTFVVHCICKIRATETFYKTALNYQYKLPSF